MREQGSIILIPVPFTDLSSTKRRPVIVISNNEYNQTTSDMVVVATTSNPSQTPYSFTISNEDLVEGQLNRPGKVRVDKIYTLSQSLAVRTFGKVSLTTMKRIRSLLGDVTKIRNTAEVTLSSCHAEKLSEKVTYPAIPPPQPSPDGHIFTHIFFYRMTMR